MRNKWIKVLECPKCGDRFRVGEHFTKDGFDYVCPSCYFDLESERQVSDEKETKLRNDQKKQKNDRHKNEPGYKPEKLKTVDESLTNYVPSIDEFLK